MKHSKKKDGMNIRCLVACTNASGSPEFVPVVVNMSQGDYLLGHHYAIAEAQAERQKFEGPFIVFDENEPVDKELREKLFSHFEWEKVEVQRLLPNCGHGGEKHGRN